MVLVRSKINVTFVKPDIFPDLERYSITVYRVYNLFDGYFFMLFPNLRGPGVVKRTTQSLDQVRLGSVIELNRTFQSSTFIISTYLNLAAWQHMCHTWEPSLRLRSPWVSYSSVVRASNRCLERHGFDSRWGTLKIYFLSNWTSENVFIYFQNSPKMLLFITLIMICEVEIHFK